MEDNASEGETNTKMEFESVLNGAIGQFGKYQIINLALLALPAIFSGFMAGDYVFTAAKLPHRCAVPECDRNNSEYRPDWILNAIPSTETGIDECHRYANKSDINTLNATCSADLFDTSNIVPCEFYVYEKTNTVVYDFGLECNEWLRALAGTLNSMGAMIALPLGGYVSDYFGRRVSIIFFSFNIALVGIVRAFSVNYSMYATLQFMHTALGGGAFSACYILAAELVGANYRVQTSATMSSLFALGQVLLGLIASAVIEWRSLTLVLFTPVLTIISYYWILTESHRWLLSKNLNEKACATLQRAAQLNGRKISDYTMDYLLTAIPKSNIIHVKDKTEKTLLLKVLKSPVLLRRCCITPVWWITTTFIYYGLSINSVSLSGNTYVNYILIAAIEIPGFWTAVLVLNRVGRKVTLFTGYMACAACCITFAFISGKNLYIVPLIVYLMGKFFIALVFTSLYLYTSELYPTRHRHSFLGFSSMMGRIGSVISPLTPPLMVYWAGIPSILFGAMCVISALLILTQPETLNLKLPDTFEDSEKIGKL